MFQKAKPDADGYYIKIAHSLDSENYFDVTNFVNNHPYRSIRSDLSHAYSHIEVCGNTPTFSALVYNAIPLTDNLNVLLFESKDVSVLDEILTNKTGNAAEPFIKMLSLISLVQEFFGISVAANWYTKSDFYNIVEGSNCAERIFMNIHMIHFFYHKGCQSSGLFSMYGNADLNSDEKFKQTLEFARQVYTKLIDLLENPYFDNLLIEFYEYAAQSLSLSKEKMMDLINSSVPHGTHAVHLIAERLDELQYAELIV